MEKGTISKGFPNKKTKVDTKVNYILNKINHGDHFQKGSGKRPDKIYSVP